jgi:MFS family permease
MQNESHSKAESRSVVTERGDARRRSHPLAALYERNFALLLFGNGLSHTGDVMEFVARSWLVLELTNSPLALGVVSFASSLPRLFLGIMAGVLADRLDRRRLLLVCSLVNMAAFSVFAILTATRLIQLWHVLAIVLLISCFSTLNIVTRQALIPDLVSRENLGNAVALHSSVSGTTQIVGQSLAGLLIAPIGVAGVLWLQAISFLAMLAALLLMHIEPATAPTERLGFRQDFGRGLQYVWREQNLLALLSLGLLPFALIQPYRALLPIFARDVLKAGSAGFGVLAAAPGLGSLAAAAAIAVLNPHRRGAIMLGSLLIASAALAGFAVSPSFLPALVALVMFGVAFNVYKILNNTLLQLMTPREMMGRVMGLYSMDRGVLPAGSLLLGWLATLLGAPAAVISVSVACGLLTMLTFVARPRLRKM